MCAREIAEEPSVVAIAALHLKLLSRFSLSRRRAERRAQKSHRDRLSRQRRARAIGRGQPTQANVRSWLSCGLPPAMGSVSASLLMASRSDRIRNRRRSTRRCLDIASLAAALLAAGIRSLFARRYVHAAREWTRVYSRAFRAGARCGRGEGWPRVPAIDRRVPANIASLAARKLPCKCMRIVFRKGAMKFSTFYIAVDTGVCFIPMMREGFEYYILELSRFNIFE